MPKILYIDDNPSMTKLFQLLGQEHEFDALIAHSVEEGLEVASHERPDVILLDIHMGPGHAEDGWMFTSALKTSEELKLIPVVACSVTYNEEGRKLALLGGFKFMNDKPYSLDKLNQILNGILPPIGSNK